MDILIYTEVENRELDAACLIKAEMERRGYSVALERYNRICEAGNMLIYRPKMIILPWLYDPNFLFNFINENKAGKLKIVNLQSEQILSDNFIQNNYHMPKKECRDGYHLAWGRVTRDRFLKNGIAKDHVIEAGNINMDFNSDNFLKVYKTKKELSDEYHLDYNKKWGIFISSFTHPSMTEAEKKSYLERFPFLEEFVDVSQNSQKILLEWFQRFVDENEDYEFIYRPHPVELNNKIISEIERKHSNFHVVQELSVRQWINVCEYNLTWFSTSIADVFFQKKSCAVLRPLRIPKEADCELFYECETISEYKDFLKYMKERQKTPFPIKKERITSYYGKQECGTIYKRFCDQLEYILKSKEKMSEMKLNCSLRSKIHRNSISFIFQLNKIINMSRFPGISRDEFIKQQLKEKWESRKYYSGYKKQMSSMLKGIISDI